MRVGGEGYVYVVETDRGIKIGWSADPTSRIRALASQHDPDLYVWAIIEGSRADERRLHRRYGRYHIRGDWFEAAEEIMADCDNGRLGSFTPAGVS